ncbi:MAG: hypothetical protein DME76_14780, partial [Verrucomicrobia bacterium]
ACAAFPTTDKAKAATKMIVNNFTIGVAAIRSQAISNLLQQRLDFFLKSFLRFATQVFTDNAEGDTNYCETFASVLLLQCDKARYLP